MFCRATRIMSFCCSLLQFGMVRDSERSTLMAG
jgi:hypothetical protein